MSSVIPEEMWWWRVTRVLSATTNIFKTHWFQTRKAFITWDCLKNSFDGFYCETSKHTKNKTREPVLAIYMSDRMPLKLLFNQPFRGLSPLLFNIPSHSFLLAVFEHVCKYTQFNAIQFNSSVSVRTRPRNFISGNIFVLMSATVWGISFSFFLK